VVGAVTVGDVEGWDADLSVVTGGLGRLFARPEPKETFGLLIRAMLADVAKKNCWGMSEHAGLPNPETVPASAQRGQLGRGRLAGLGTRLRPWRLG
jgi:hypothetical protein